jgi:hypothetical protein
LAGIVQALSLASRERYHASRRSLGPVLELKELHRDLRGLTTMVPAGTRPVAR